MKISVSQYGARRRYMIPRLLYEKGLLDVLYTDSTADSTVGRIAAFITKFKKNNQNLNRLLNRNTGIPRKLVCADDRLQLKILLNKLRKKDIFKIVEMIFEGSSSRFIKRGIGKIDWLYVMFIENYHFTQYAKSRGVKIIADIYENPFIWKELSKEIDKDAYRSIKNLRQFYCAQAKLREKYVDKLLAIADQYIVPSDYVKDCLKQSKEFCEDKVNVIPYFSSVKNTEYNNSPQRGRIIWVGNDVVRKGLCYCAESATILKQKYDFIDFRIIGPVPPELTKDELYRDLNFIGYCNKKQLQNEFMHADIFVFPTLAEGFAGVLLEASSFGVPIITTHASGFAKDAPCIFVPQKNTKAIVEEVSNLIDNRQYRNQLSLNLFNYSQRNQSDQFSDKLIELLKKK